MKKSLAIVTLSLLAFSFSCFAQMASAQNSASIKIEDNAKPATSVTTETKTINMNLSTPYKLVKGKRDPFVPFGGNLAPATTIKTVFKTETVVSKDGKKETVTKVATQPSATQNENKKEVKTLPIKATGTMISAGSSYAILTAETGGASYMVKPGDKVGEYTVRSISAREVVLIWKGKAYSIPVKEEIVPSKAAQKAPAAGLPSPEEKK